MTALLILIIYFLMGLHVGKKQYEYFLKTSSHSDNDEVNFVSVVCGIFWPIILAVYLFFIIFIAKWNWGGND